MDGSGAQTEENCLIAPHPWAQKRGKCLHDMVKKKKGTNTKNGCNHSEMCIYEWAWA